MFKNLINKVLKDEHWANTLWNSKRLKDRLSAEFYIEYKGSMSVDKECKYGIFCTVKYEILSM